MTAPSTRSASTGTSKVTRILRKLALFSVLLASTANACTPATCEIAYDPLFVTAHRSTYLTLVVRGKYSRTIRTECPLGGEKFGIVVCSDDNVFCYTIDCHVDYVDLRVLHFNALQYPLNGPQETKRDPVDWKLHDYFWACV
ncbi:hypothetical protein BC939DRAFT_437317 [Gamsiella multidivaricata]|uniref:uncharacterized protein n=1 Tax=Gamsiella multidivaricata TaxID=101098 RepID=UPI00221F36BF|nr:uncharacterized protein BC939DRAFT_437317 [Gamsiella multidivaricata]KAG0347459.1 hypothetical protein BGZ54_004913 [Gamsiella multidivaricata]KAI7831528.1 hypothetical protein BC939DRAFT_437317 [Gamsiella multidivaricata]